MTRSAAKKRVGAFALALVAASIVLVTPASAAVPPKPQFVGIESPSKTLNITVALNLRNQAKLNVLVKENQSASFTAKRHFMTKQEFASEFAPTAASSKAVQEYLTSKGLTITYADKYNLVVRASGTAENLGKAFGTQIGSFRALGEEFSKPLSTPAIPGAVGSAVKTITGFTAVKAHSFAMRAKNVKTGQPLPGVAVKGHKNGAFFPSDCFEASSPVYLYGSGLEAIYSGNGYTVCGYGPADIQHAYGFDTVINSGLNGAGQTIVIVDAYGSYTLPEDVAEFDTVYGLPPINLNVIYNPTGGTPDCVVANGVQCGWEGEVSMDVEYAHAMAPEATIDLVVSPTANFSDLANIDLWVAENIGPASASHSFGFPEWLLVDYYGDIADYDWQAYVNFVADTVFGVSNNYSSGDDGDYVTLGKDLYPDVSFPSGLQNATSVGGTSLAIASNGSYKWENGWGTNATFLNYAPPDNLGFIYGGGGGTSLITAAPSWQYDFLGNSARQQPDVAMDADPFTGAEVILTPNGVAGGPQYVEVFGGTSLSCPMFSALWSIVAQVAESEGVPGGRLGNAAPILYEENALFPGSFNDVKPVSSGANAHGTIFYNGIPTSYSQWDLAEPYQNSQYFWESIWNAGGGYYYTVTFGTDSSLTTGPGWDNVTGVGTPAGTAFIGPFTE